MNLVRFAHNWNVETMEHWINALWDTGTVIYFIFKIDTTEVLRYTSVVKNCIRKGGECL